MRYGFPTLIPITIVFAISTVPCADAASSPQGSLSFKLDTLHQDLQDVLKALEDSGRHDAATNSAIVAPRLAPNTTMLTEGSFPSDPGLAKFPSPENSRILRTETGISGRPYLLDTNGAVHELVPVTAAVPNGYTVNGVWAKGGGSDHVPVPQLLVRQGKVFAQAKGGPWQLFNNDRSSLYNASLPDAFSKK